VKKLYVLWGRSLIPLEQQYVGLQSYYDLYLFGDPGNPEIPSRIFFRAAPLMTFREFFFFIPV
jgi:hypothetical protein